MSSAFHVAVGPFIIDVRLDDSGIHMQRGAFSETIAWEKISGATLFREPHHDESQAQQEEERAAKFLGADAVQKIRSLRDKAGQMVVAYHDDKNHLHESQIPAPLDDPAFLQEFETRLGPRWLGESVDRQQAAKRLHTNPGFFKMMFVLVALFGIIAVVAAIALLGFLGPVLNFLSIQKMLLDLQDGNLMSFASRLATYVALLVIGFLLQRTIRGLFVAQRARIVSKLPGKS
jgi:hypothetical protein